MPSLQLNSRLSGHDTGGKFIYLGYISWVNAALTTNPNHPSQRGIVPNGNSGNCFGMATEVNNIANADATPSVLEYIATSTNNPYDTDTNTVPIAAQGAVLSYNTNINFTGKLAGYYGFMYMVGDINNDGVLTSECGDIECFEVEVVEEYPSYSPLVLTYCENDVPSTLNLYTLLNAENSGSLIAGGTWGGSNGITGSTLNTGTGEVIGIPTPTATGTFSYVYTLGVAQMGAYHNVLPGTCTTSTTIVTIIVTPTLSAGLGESIAVCNG